MKSRQTGGTAVEFALVLLMFSMFLLAILDFSRMLFTWNAANEATRAGARYAVVCDTTGNQAQVLARMRRLLPQIQSISMTWIPASCTPETCEGVTVSITNLNHRWISPILGFSPGLIPMPSFSTFLTREVMGMDPHSNAICS